MQSPTCDVSTSNTQVQLSCNITLYTAEFLRIQHSFINRALSHTPAPLWAPQSFTVTQARLSTKPDILRYAEVRAQGTLWYYSTSCQYPNQTENWIMFARCFTKPTLSFTSNWNVTWEWSHESHVNFTRHFSHAVFMLEHNLSQSPILCDFQIVNESHDSFLITCKWIRIHFSPFLLTCDSIIKWFLYVIPFYMIHLWLLLANESTSFLKFIFFRLHGLVTI